MTEFADTYGYPGPEGKDFYRVLALTALVIFLAIASQPLWNHFA